MLLSILCLTLHFLGDMIEYCLARSDLCDACLTDMHKNILMDALLLGSYFIIIKQQQTHNYTRWWIFLSWNPISHHLPSWKSHVAKWGLEKEYRFHVIWYIMIYILIPNEHIIEYTKLFEFRIINAGWNILLLNKNHYKNFSTIIWHNSLPNNLW